ncbi:MAG: hypothetical protein LBF04_07620, partial [Prevotellaceae bacterium]|nr:hypothetical protein [Prevotellaceae bacterium]
NTKTLFPPYFHNKTTLVEQKITHTSQPYCFIVHCYLHPGGMRISKSVNATPKQKNLISTLFPQQNNLSNTHLNLIAVLFIVTCIPAGCIAR